jgi:hypothetical protein
MATSRPTLVAAAHADSAPPALLSVNKVAGNCPGVEAGAVGPKLRLFVSPVKLFARQDGAFLVPLFTLVLTTRADPALKSAWDPQPSPKILNSATSQACARLRMLSAALVEKGVAPTHIVTASLPPFMAAPLRSMFCSVVFVIVCAGTGAAPGLFWKQSS